MSGKKKIAWGQKPEAIFTEFIVGIDQWKITVNNREQSSVRRDTWPGTALRGQWESGFPNRKEVLRQA